MSGTWTPSEELESLSTAAYCGELSDEGIARLDILLHNPQACRWWRDCCLLQAELRFLVSADKADATAHANIHQAETSPSSVPVVGFFGRAAHGTANYFSEGMPLGYLVATVVFSLALLVGSLITVSHHVQIAQDNSPPTAESSAIGKAETPSPEKMEFIGRITGMVDCRWADESTASINGAYVPLGRKYSLSSGLMEITYDTGAKVILHGPVMYEVESRDGGYLLVGKLTARVESNNKVASKSEIRNSSPSTTRQPLFTIKTPTAIVTDLGTEFGVEVDAQGFTTSHVFRGSVRLETVYGEGDKTLKPAVQVLHENQSARVEVDKDLHISIRLTTPTKIAFVRKLPERVTVAAFNTGTGVEEGESDSHWQVVAVSNDPDSKPQPAIVAATIPRYRLPNDAQSKWVSLAKGVCDSTDYTFRTTFDLSGMRPGTAMLRGEFIADNHVRAIRLNGQDIHVPLHSDRHPFDAFTTFTATSAFVEDMNTLEIVVTNNIMDKPNRLNPMGLRVKMQVFALEK